jgi:hypothetical protein
MFRRAVLLKPFRYPGFLGYIPTLAIISGRKMSIISNPEEGYVWSSYVAVNGKRSTDESPRFSPAGMAAGRIPVGTATRENNPSFAYRGHNRRPKQATQYH